MSENCITVNELTNGNGSCSKLSRVEKDFLDHQAKKDWTSFYEGLKKHSLEASKGYSKNTGKLLQNVKLNRYNNVIAYDHSRVVLLSGSVNYICANFVEVERAERRYILSQGPLDFTIGHFWLMVWEQNCRAIIMLNNLKEGGTQKCAPYWPKRLGAKNAMFLADVNITVEMTRSERYKNFIRRWFKITSTETNDSREVLHFHYISWADFGMPTSPRSLLEFLLEIRRSGAFDNKAEPAVVHCSAGIGRSGTFCLVDTCLKLIEKNIDFDVADILCDMRTYREGLVQNYDQLFFAYSTIVEGLKLLKDPTFLNQKLEPITHAAETESEDEISKPHDAPPPLPERNASLKLPQAPKPDGVLALHVKNKNGSEQHQSENSLRDRPLPPLPARLNNNLDYLHGSDSENSDDSEAFMTSESDDDSGSSDELDLEDDVNCNDARTENGLTVCSEQHNDDHVNANKEDTVDVIVNNIKESNNDNKLKRHPRVEHQAELERKVNDIKRKRREIEETASNKKRRLTQTLISLGVGLVAYLVYYCYFK